MLIVFCADDAHREVSVKRILSLILLLGAVVGLFGQGVALASGPAWQSSTTVASMPDCMEAMQSDPEGEPCEGITLDCIAAMGCVIPFTLTNGPSAPGGQALVSGMRPVALVDRLDGRALSPEPEPPAL